MSKKEWLLYGVMGFGISFGVLFLFYQKGWIAMSGAVLGGVAFSFYQKKRVMEQRKWQLMVEFKDAMDSMVAALVAGYSMENAVKEAYKDLQLMYKEETPMLQELKEIRQKLELKYSLDDLLLELGRKSEVEDIITFAQIYATARRSGGNLVKVMKRTADNIGEKMEMQREIQTAIAGKKMEATCMMVIPILIILYLQFFSPGFLDPLYENWMGHLFMTGALMVYGFSVWWSQKIMNVKY